MTRDNLSAKLHSRIMSRIHSTSDTRLILPKCETSSRSRSRSRRQRKSKPRSRSRSRSRTPKNKKSVDRSTQPKNHPKFKWEPMDDKWQHILLSSNFVVKDTVPDGNCQFRAIEQAMKGILIGGKKLSHKRLRKMIADYVLRMPDIHFNDIIQTYRIERDNGEFYGNWDPFKIKTKRQFSLQVKKPGFHFEGDYTTLSLLTKVLNTDIIVFNEESHLITKIESNNKRFIILNYIQFNNTGHYRVIGLKQQNVKKVDTIFEKEHMDANLKIIFDRKLFFCKHIEHIYNNSTNEFTCSSMISDLESLTDVLTISDKKIIYKLLGKVISKMLKNNSNRKIPLHFKM